MQENQDWAQLLYSGSREPGCSDADKRSLVVRRPEIRFTGIQCVHRHRIRIDYRSVAATILMSAMQILIITQKIITVDVIGCGNVVLIH